MGNIFCGTWVLAVHMRRNDKKVIEYNVGMLCVCVLPLPLLLFYAVQIEFNICLFVAIFLVSFVTLRCSACDVKKWTIAMTRKSERNIYINWKIEMEKRPTKYALMLRICEEESVADMRYFFDEKEKDQSMRKGQKEWTKAFHNIRHRILLSPMDTDCKPNRISLYLQNDIL